MTKRLHPDQPDTPPLTAQRRDAIRAMAATYGMMVTWRQDGERWLAQVDGMSNTFEGADAQIHVQLGPVLPRFAVKEPGGSWSRTTRRWRVIIWANAPFDVYMRRSMLPETPIS